MSHNPGEINDLAEVAELVRAFESCAVAPAAFGHRQHLTVALSYLAESDLARAADSMRTGLKNLLAHHGIDGYHETITLFWLKRLDRSIRELREERLDPPAIDSILTANADAKTIFLFYSRDLLMSDRARREWTPPDLRPLDD